MRGLLLVVLLAASGCGPRVVAPRLENHVSGKYVELAWHARMDERDWVQVTLVVDGKAYPVGPAGGPDDDGDTAPEGCTSEPDKANAAIQTFYCGAASRWYSATLEGGEVVVTRVDEWFEPHRRTTAVVGRIKVRGTRLYVAPYRAT